MKNKKGKENLENNEDDVNLIKNETATKVKGNRGRKKGDKTGERQEILILIGDTYRINLSDGKNKILQKLITSTSELTEEDLLESENGEVSDWKFRGYWSTFKAAFCKLYDLMLEDKIKDKGGIVTVKEFIDIAKETETWLKEIFKNDFVDDGIVSKPKHVKKVEEKKGK
ncbi:MAG: hypothetical protein PHT02_00715 [Tissierellia bacterium]|nr:hypothetical protein [Tissierellia bacterium]